MYGGCKSDPGSSAVIPPRTRCGIITETYELYGLTSAIVEQVATRTQLRKRSAYIYSEHWMSFLSETLLSLTHVRFSDLSIMPIRNTEAQASSHRTI